MICKNLQSQAGETQLSLRSLSSAFLLLGIGLGLAAGSFLLEIGCNLWQQLYIKRAT